MSKIPRNILTQYLNDDGILVTVYISRKPRANEKTWKTGAKYTIANIGRKGQTLRNEGLVGAKG